jgi:hypothetical protein
MYLQFLSFYETHAGFALLRDLIFHRSPQLNGSYRDFRADITNLIIVPGEHLSKFYQRTLQLHTEISLANIPNGSSTDLCYRFLELLRNTGCSTIQGLTLPYWQKITTHRRNPNHLTAPLPWSFKEVYNTLESSNINNLPGSSSSSLPSPDPGLLSPIAAFGSSSHRNKPTTYNNKSNNNNHQSSNNNNTSKSSTNNNNFGIHRTRDGRKFITTSNLPTIGSSHIACALCFNKHVNPWHQTENCPYKHPTHIIDKETHERIMQHNAIYGTEKKDFTKNQDLPHSGPHPPRTAAAGCSTVLGTPIDATHDPIPILPSSSTTDIDLTRLEEGNPLTADDEIIESEYFTYPIVPEANVGQPTSSDTTSDEIITDHLQYLSYYS